MVGEGEGRDERGERREERGERRDGSSAYTLPLASACLPAHGPNRAGRPTDSDAMNPYWASAALTDRFPSIIQTV